MKKHTEKPPIDDLFARKLGGASLQPSSNGFERLQARMKPNQPEARIIFWQNPAVQRYMAVAACLLAVAGFGWLYWSSDNNLASDGTQIAANQTSVGPRSVGPRSAIKSKTESQVETTAQAPVKTRTEPTLANTSVTSQPKPALSVAERNQDGLAQTKRSTGNVKTQRSAPSATLLDATIAQTDKQQAIKPAPGSNGATPSAIESTTNLPDRPTPANAAVANAPTRNLPAERVLVVTIAEPETLVAARQAAQSTTADQSELAATDKAPKETKVGNLWQQVKRAKQGELFARRADNDDENGLLSRAYNGLKHSFDKEKSAKQ